MRYKAMYEKVKIKVAMLKCLVRDAYVSGYVCGQENKRWTQELWLGSWVEKQLQLFKAGK